MKRISFLQVVVLTVLMVSVVSCGVPMGASSDYYEEAPVRSNVYYNDPYYSAPQTVIIERDPFTGRYYQVSPGPYNRVYSTPVYPRSGRRTNHSRYYEPERKAPARSNNYYRNYQQQQQPQQTPEQRLKEQKQREEAKESILGKKRN